MGSDHLDLLCHGEVERTKVLTQQFGLEGRWRRRAWQELLEELEEPRFPCGTTSEALVCQSSHLSLCVCTCGRMRVHVWVYVRARVGALSEPSIKT